MTRLLCLVALASLLACGGEAVEELTAADRAEIDRLGDSSSSVQQAFRAVDHVMEFDPTLDASKTAEANAQAILDRATGGAACVQGSLTGTTVTVDFGAPPGCALRGSTVSGSMTLAVSKSASTLSVEVTFGSLVVDGQSLSGTVKLTTTGATTFDTTLDLTTGTKRITGAVTVKGSTGAFTLDGTLHSTVAGETTDASLVGVHYTVGACYPDAGTMSATVGRTATTVAFLATTPTDGKVKVTKGRVVTTVSLPAYGSCPK